MTEAFPKHPPQPAADDDETAPSEGLDTLRRILVGPETARICRLERRIDKAGVKAQELSHVLPEAIALGTAKNRKLARSLQPTIEDAIRVSVQKNPKALADAIFPSMGPGIRKAISAAIMGMIQSFNQLLNHSFSMSGVKWRIEAIRTRRPYAEIVLLHTLLYQVEQVFLIHRQNGLVLQHVVGAAVKFQDPDLVSGMLTAIEDFVHDSFDVASDSALDTLRIGGDRSVWIEHGPKAMIAAVIRGTPPLAYRHRLAETLDDIHIKFRRPLDQYDGDAIAFETARNDLMSCLDTELKASQQKTSPWLWVIVLVLLAATASWALTSLHQYRRTQRFLSAIRAQPGVVLTAADKQNGRLVISGLKDPLADDPKALVRAHDLSDDRVEFRWRPYLSLAPQMVLMRAQQLLSPPPTVTLKLDGDVLVVSGEAGHQWIQRLREQGATTVGINHTRMDELIDSDVKALQQSRQRIERARILFPLRSRTILADQAPLLNDLAREMQAIERLSGRLARPFKIRIVGYTDDSGPATANQKLSQARAESVRRFLIDNAKVTIAMIAVGMGPTPNTDNLADERFRAKRRFVGFELVDAQGND